MNMKEKLDLLFEAVDCIGVPYLYGGETTDGFDCSGLMQYLYKKIDKDIPRTTYGQIKDGIEVSKDSLEIGDLLFFGKDEPYHVGMYVGNNKMIETPHTGKTVRRVPYENRNDFICARRILDNKEDSYASNEQKKAIEEVKKALKNARKSFEEYEEEIKNIDKMLDELDNSLREK